MTRRLLAGRRFAFERADLRDGFWVPAGAARTLPRVIEANPEAVLEALAG